MIASTYDTEAKLNSKSSLGLFLCCIYLCNQKVMVWQKDLEICNIGSGTLVILVDVKRRLRMLQELLCGNAEPATAVDSDN